MQRILDDLEAGGYLTRQREGRSNAYEQHPERPMQHPAQQTIAVGVLLGLLEAGWEEDGE